MDSADAKADPDSTSKVSMYAASCKDGARLMLRLVHRCPWQRHRLWSCLACRFFRAQEQLQAKVASGLHTRAS